MSIIDYGSNAVSLKPSFQLRTQHDDVTLVLKACYVRGKLLIISMTQSSKTRNHHNHMNLLVKLMLHVWKRRRTILLLLLKLPRTIMKLKILHVRFATVESFIGHKRFLHGNFIPFPSPFQFNFLLFGSSTIQLPCQFLL